MRSFVRDGAELNCGQGGGADTYFKLRIASIFIIFVGSTFGALFPVVAHRTSWISVPKVVFECVLHIATRIILKNEQVHQVLWLGSHRESNILSVRAVTENVRLQLPSSIYYPPPSMHLDRLV